MAEMRAVTTKMVSSGTRVVKAQPKASFVPGVMCEKCNNRLVELKRQVLRSILPELQGLLQSGKNLNTGALSSRIAHQLRMPETHTKSWRHDRCDVCATDLDQLKREAITMVHTLEESQFMAYYNIPGYLVGPNADQLIRRADKLRFQGSYGADPGERSAGYARSSEDATPSFFARAAQKLSISSKKKHKKGHSYKDVPTTPLGPDPYGACGSRHKQSDPHAHAPPYPFPTKFKEALRMNSPAVPPTLLKNGIKRTDGKVKVMLRIGPSFPGERGSFMKVDAKRKQVTLYDPSTVGHVSQTHRKMGVAAPKMFVYDAIFESDASQMELCSRSTVDVLQAVVNGTDGCIFVYGHSGLGKTYSMIGRDDQAQQSFGIIPSSLSWLFKLISEQKQKTGTRFSVRVSAVEIVGRSENMRDLLAEQSSGSDSTTTDTPNPSVFLREDRNGGVQLLNSSELRASSAEKAAYYLDAALAARTRPKNDKNASDSEREETTNSHMFFTVHLYQYRVDKNSKNAGGVHGGRSRLHLVDLASCEGYTKKEGGASSMSLSGLGNVIIALINGAKHVPHRTSKITRLLQESIGNPTCRTTMIAHVSPSLPFYNETLATVQLAARLHRLRKRKGKGSGTSSSGGDSSCDEARIRKPRLRVSEPRLRTSALSDRLREDCPVGEPVSSDYNSSTGEESCDTVIYCGPDGSALSDRELTDNEGPPPMEPIAGPNRDLAKRLAVIEKNEEEEEEKEGKIFSYQTGQPNIPENNEHPLNESSSSDSLEKQQKLDLGRDEIEPEAKVYNTEVEVTDGEEETEYSDTDGNVTEIEIEKSRSSPPTKPKVETVLVPSRFGPNMDVDVNMNTVPAPAKVVSVSVLTEEQCKIAHRFSSSTSSDSDTEGVTMVQEPNFSFRTIKAAEKLDRSSLSLNELGLTGKESLEQTSSGSLDNLHHGSTKSLDESGYFGKNSQFLIESIENLDKNFDGPVGEALQLDWKDKSTSDVGTDEVTDESSASEMLVDEGESCGATSHVSITSVDLVQNHDLQTDDGKRRCGEDVIPAEKVFVLTDSQLKTDGNAEGKGTSYVDKHHKYRIETARLVEQCQPLPFTKSEESCYVLGESKDDEYAYDYNDLIMSMKEEDEEEDVILVDAYLTDDINATDYPHEIADEDDLSEQVYSPEEEELQNLEAAKIQKNTEVKTSSISRSNSDESTAESEHEIPRSPAMETPMKLFYHLVPSPHSSSNEDSETDDAQTARQYEISVKSLSPIPECPSQEESIDNSVDSLMRGDKRGSCTYSIVSVEVDDAQKAVVMDADSPEPILDPKEIFRSINPDPVLIETLPPTKKDLRSLLEKFVAQQLRECESDDKPRSRLWSSPVVCQPLPVYPVERKPELETQVKAPCTSERSDSGDVMLPPLTPRKTRVRPRTTRFPITNSEEEDVMLPPLKPETALSRSKTRSSTSGSSENESLKSPINPRQPVARSNRARVIRSPKLHSKVDQSDCRSDIVPFTGRNLRKYELLDYESSDSSTAMTEPLNFDAVRKKLPQPLCHSTPRIYSSSADGSHPSVIFLGTDKDSDKSGKRNSDSQGLEEITKTERTNSNSDIERRTMRPSRARTKESRESTSSIVRLTYCGSVLSNSEDEVIPDLPSAPDEPSTPLKTLSVRAPKMKPKLDKPKLEFLAIPSKSPYAPQDEFKIRYGHRRTSPKIVYRISGEFVPPNLGEPTSTVTSGGERLYRLSGEFAATIVTTSGSPTDTVSSAIQALADSMAKASNHRLSGDFVATVVAETTESSEPETSGSSHDALRSSIADSQRASLLSAVSSCRNSRCRSTEVVWTTLEPTMSDPQISADENSMPDTPAVDIKDDRMEQLKLYRHDRRSLSYSSGHASDSSVTDSPGTRASRGRPLTRSKSASSRSDAASSSGYESMRYDYSHASSDSCSERGSFPSKKKRGLRRRSKSEPPSSRKTSRNRWFGRKSFEEPVKIKVYEVDDVDTIRGATTAMDSEDIKERRKCVRHLRQKQQSLKEELSLAKKRLMEDQKRWSFGLRADGRFDLDDPKFIEALELENTTLEKRIQICKSNLMMLTSFDVVVTSV